MKLIKIISPIIIGYSSYYYFYFNYIKKNEDIFKHI